MSEDYSTCYIVDNIIFAHHHNNTPFGAYVYVHQDDDVEETILNAIEKMGNGRVKYFNYVPLGQRKPWVHSTINKGGK